MTVLRIAQSHAYVLCSYLKCGEEVRHSFADEYAVANGPGVVGVHSKAGE